MTTTCLEIAVATGVCWKNNWAHESHHDFCLNNKHQRIISVQWNGPIAHQFHNLRAQHFQSPFFVVSKAELLLKA